MVKLDGAGCPHVFQKTAESPLLLCRLLKRFRLMKLSDSGGGFCSVAR